MTRTASTPTIAATTIAVDSTPTTIDNLHAAVPMLDAPTIAWENEVYSADPLGGAPSAY